MKKYRLCFVLGMTLILCGVSVISARAQSNETTIRVEPANLQVGQGQTETIRLVIENGQDIYGIDLHASYDSEVIEIVDADETKPGTQMHPGNFLKPDFVVQNQADNQTGTAQYVITQMNPSPPANGSGVVLEIMVRGKTRGSSTPLTLTQVELADRRGTMLNVTAQDGNVEIVAPKAITVTPHAKAQASAEPTRAQETRAATRVRATPTTTAMGQTSNSDLMTNLILIVIALGGCFGAVVVLGLILFLVFRRPRAKPPFPTLS